MKKRIFKQGMALMLAAALALPANVVPAEILDQQTETELPHIVLNQETPDEKVTDSDAKEKEEQTGTQTETKKKTEVNTTETVKDENGTLIIAGYGDPRNCGTDHLQYRFLQCSCCKRGRF